MRIPAAKIHLNHAHSGFDQAPNREKCLTPFLATIQVSAKRNA